MGGATDNLLLDSFLYFMPFKISSALFLGPYDVKKSIIYMYTNSPRSVRLIDVNLLVSYNFRHNFSKLISITFSSSLY